MRGDHSEYNQLRGTFNYCDGFPFLVLKIK